jgi:hypothetical protein
MEWNYIWSAIFINVLIVLIVPKIFKKPTGIQVVDDVILYINSQKSFLIASSIVLAFIIWASHYWLEKREAPATASSPKKF